jgi:hypothetical protein
MRAVLAVAVVILVFVTGCAARERVAVKKEEPAVCAFLGDACELLKPAAQSEAGLRYVNPTVDFTKYNKVMVDVVGFFGSDVAKVLPKDQQALTDLFHKTLTAQLAKRYQIVDQPGPGVARVQVALLDGEAATAGARSISLVIPKKQVPAAGASVGTGRYPFAGGAQAVAKLTDSVTGQLLGAAVDRGAGGGAVQSAGQRQWLDAENAIKAWSEMMVGGLYSYTSGARKP